VQRTIVIRPLFAAVLAGALVATGAPTGWAAGPSHLAGTGPLGPQTVVLALAPRDVSGLHALAGRGGRLSPQVREARRHQALGGLARAAQVADTVQSLGLQVVGSSETSVTASGSAQQLQALFGCPAEFATAADCPAAASAAGRSAGVGHDRGWRRRVAPGSPSAQSIPPRGPFGRRVAANLRRPRPERGHR